MRRDTLIEGKERHVAVKALHGPVDVLLAELQASRGGLTAAAARRRLGEVGPNEPARTPRTAGLVQILLLLANPLVITLLIASAASAILGERVNASIIVVMVALGVGLKFVQTSRSHRAAERLRDVVVPTATVLRDGLQRDPAARPRPRRHRPAGPPAIACRPTRGSSRRATCTSSRPR